MVRCVALSVLGVKGRRNSVIAGKIRLNTRDLSWMRQPAAISRASVIPAGLECDYFEISARRADIARPFEEKLIGQLTKPSASDKLHPQRCARPAGIVPPKVWPKSESLALDIVRQAQSKDRQCRSADAWQNPARGWSRRLARSGCEYQNPGSVRRTHDPVSGNDKI